MPISELRAKELAQIEPPRSMQRLIKLFDELSRDPIMASGDSHAGGIGSTAAKALRMADQIEATSPFGGHGKTDLVDFLMDRHNVSSAELSDFSRWLVKWNDKRSQMEVLQAPEMFLGSKGLEEPTGLHWDTLSALSRRRQTAGQPESVSTERLVPPQTTSVAPGEKVVVKEVVVEKVRTQEVAGPRSVEVRVIESKGAAASAEVGKPDVLSQAWTRGRGAEMPAASGVPGEALAPAMSLSPAQQAVDLSQLIGATSRGLWTSNLQGGSMVSGLYYGQHTAPTPGAFTPVVPQAPPVLPPHPIPPPMAAPPARALADRGFQHADGRQQISPQQRAVATPTPVAQSKLAAKSQVGPDLAKAPSPGGPVPVPYPTIAQRAVGVGGPLMALTAGAAASNLIHRNLFVIPGVPGQAPVLGPPKDHAALLASLKPGQRPPVEAVSPL
ncbi:MAG TPA: hypothetical protein VM328_08860, partial [Fimbriimonadaceae bacterium]|nr:hypothetical protein [Fimbriimonadaceae bacterium]